MVDGKIQKNVTETVMFMLKFYKSAGPGEEFRETWGCENLGDFLCGYFVGEVTGLAIAEFWSEYGRAPTLDEEMDIMDAVEVHTKEIKEYFSKLN